MNKLKESILNDAKKVVKILVMQVMILPILAPVPPPLLLVLSTILVIYSVGAVVVLAIGA